MLATHQHKPTDSHILSAKHAIKYLKGTKNSGISFNSNTEDKLTSYLYFPVTLSKIQGISEGNWGPQDQSTPDTSKPLPELELFKTRSISGHVVTLFGPLQWTSKRQKITELYATEECAKDLLHLRHIILDLELEEELLHKQTTMYNDNIACVLWSKNTTTKGLRHLQIRENTTRETISITIEHICGKIHPEDLFTKEDKYSEHFQRLRDTIVVQPDPHVPNKTVNDKSSIRNKDNIDTQQNIDNAYSNAISYKNNETPQETNSDKISSTNTSTQAKSQTPNQNENEHFQNIQSTSENSLLYNQINESYSFENNAPTVAVINVQHSKR